MILEGFTDLTKNLNNLEIPDLNNRFSNEEINPFISSDIEADFDTSIQDKLDEQTAEFVKCQKIQIDELVKQNESLKEQNIINENNYNELKKQTMTLNEQYISLYDLVDDMNMKNKLDTKEALINRWVAILSLICALISLAISFVR